MIRQPDDPRQMEFSCRADLVLDEALVLLIEEVVNSLNLDSLYARYSEAGRSFYDPSMQLKVLFFGYCDGVRSCRDLAKHIRYDIRYRYFCGSLRPDFRTLNRFRKDNLDLLSDYFAQIVLLCQESGLLDSSLLALDGTKLRASSSRGRTFRKPVRDKLAEDFRRQLREDITSDNCDDECDCLPSGEEAADAGLKPPGSVKVTDPDARFMKTSDGGKRPCYNSQVVVDQHQVIVAADVSNIADDSVQFQPMMKQCRQVVGQDPDKVMADGGYYSGDNLRYAVSEGIDLYLPVAETGRVPDRRFHRDAFVYDPSTDSYRCPAGRRLHYRGSRIHRGVPKRIYAGCASDCGCCRFRPQCTKTRYRRLEISKNYCYERQMKTKLQTAAGRAIYCQRKVMVEPVFGNLKFNLGFVRFALRSLKKVKGEFLLMCIAHNLKKLARYRQVRKAAAGLKYALILLFSSILALFNDIPRRFRQYHQKIRIKINVPICKPEYTNFWDNLRGSDSTEIGKSLITAHAE
jgi:transposase